jgi:hypothetical protein
MTEWSRSPRQYVLVRTLRGRIQRRKASLTRRWHPPGSLERVSETCLAVWHGCLSLRLVGRLSLPVR